MECTRHLYLLRTVGQMVKGDQIAPHLIAGLLYISLEIDYYVSVTLCNQITKSFDES